MSKKVTHNILTLTLSRVIAGVLVFLGYRALFHYLTPFQTGQFQFALSYVLLFGVVVDFGIQELVIKRVSENKQLAKKYFGNFFAVEIVIAGLLYALLLALSYTRQLDPIVHQAIAVVGFGMFLNAFTNPYTAIISAHEDMHLIAIVNFFDSLINVSVMFLTILLHRSIVFLASVQAIMGIMHVLVYSRLIKRYIDKLELWQHIRKLDWQLFKQMFLAALPFGSLIGFSIIYNKIDVLILFHLKGEVQTGIYAASYKFFDYLGFFPAVVSSALFPYFSTQMHKGDFAAVRRALENYTKYMLLLAVPIALGGVALAPKLMLFMADPQYYSGFMSLQFLVFAMATLFMYSAVNSLVINQLTRHAVFITFANIFINGIGNFLLIPHFGFRAAALMTFVSELCQALFYFWCVQTKIVRFPVLRYLFKPLLAGLIMLAAIWHVRTANLLLTIPLGAVVYITVLFITGTINKTDITRFKSVLRPGSAAQEHIVG